MTSSQRVLFLHGFAGSGSEWDSLQESVPAEAPNLRPTGTREQYVADVVELIGDGPVTLIGQSLGGHTAFLVAARHPELVERLVVIESDPERDPEAPDRIRKLLEEHAAPYGVEVGAEDASKALAEVAARDWWDEWRRIQCPVLVIHGERGMVTRSVAEQMASTVPSGREIEIADAGHDLHLEQPGRVGRLVAEFLEPGIGPEATLRAVAPAIVFRDEYLAALAEEPEPEGDTVLRATTPEAFKEMVQGLRDMQVGRNLPKGLVPATEFWLVDGKRFVGRVSIRHQLNDQLREIGGHIGFWIRPSERGKGYGSRR